ncbi:MAG: hypothetical protein OCD03_07340 [Hyphomicrobiales bacterium]
MKHADLISRFTNIGRNHQWDKLNDLLTVDFYFKSSLNYVSGAKNFIEFERNRNIISCFETLHLFESYDECKYYHIYNLIYLDPEYFVLPVHETICVKDNLVSCSILNAEFETTPYYKNLIHADK